MSKLCTNVNGNANKDNNIKDAKNTNNNKQIQNLKDIIKKLNDQLTNDKKNGMVMKLNQGKIKIL